MRFQSGLADFNISDIENWTSSLGPPPRIYGLKMVSI